MAKISTIRERVHQPLWDSLVKQPDPVQQMVDLGYDRDVLQAVVSDPDHPEREIYAVLAALNGIDLFRVDFDQELDRAEFDAGYLFPGLAKDKP